MTMKFISELNESVEVLVEEAAGNGKKNYFLEGMYIEADTKNRNGRYYPMGTVRNEVQRFNEQSIKTNRALGELGHPAGASINLDRVSHMLTSLKEHGNTFIGRSKILDTPFGKIAKNFVDEGVKLGVSTRGFGSIMESKGMKVVGPDFHLSTVDIVADPSGPNCFVNGIMEGKEFYLKEGVLTEVTMEQTQREVRALTKTQLDEGALIKLFENFLKGKK